MNLAAPVTETLRGLKGFLRGWQWLKRHPKSLALLFTPMAIGIVIAIAGLSTFISYDDELLAKIMFAKPEDWWWIPFYWIAYWFLWVSSIGLVLLSTMLLINVMASPVYEHVSLTIEKQMTGQAPPEMNLFGNLKVMVVELKKVMFVITVSLLTLLIPVVNIFSTVIAAFLVGWDFFDFPAARHGWSFGQRIKFVFKEFWSVLGLGLWLVIPILQMFFMPLAVAGGTILSLEALEKSGELTLTQRTGESSHAAVSRS